MSTEPGRASGLRIWCLPKAALGQERAGFTAYLESGRRESKEQAASGDTCTSKRRNGNSGANRTGREDGEFGKDGPLSPCASRDCGYLGNMQKQGASDLTQGLSEIETKRFNMKRSRGVSLGQAGRRPRLLWRVEVRFVTAVVV